MLKPIKKNFDEIFLLLSFIKQILNLKNQLIYFYVL